MVGFADCGMTNVECGIILASLRWPNVVNIQHSTFNIKNSTFNTQHSTLLRRMKKNFWEVVIRIAIAALTAALTALGTTSCMGYGPF